MKKIKIISIVGARPQFIKLAAIVRTIDNAPFKTKLLHKTIHTGQHYDYEMSKIFYQELKLPEPDYNLGVGSHTPVKQINKMMEGIEEILVQEKPDMVLVYGDTNTTLAGALSSVYLKIPVAHIEAGLRSFRMDMPEEINRIITDRISTLLFCPTRSALDNIKKEGRTKNVWLSGDIMYDIFLHFQKYIRNTAILNKFGVSPKHYFLLTIHRNENKNDPESVIAILEALEQQKVKTIFLIHPGTEKILKSIKTFSSDRYKNVIISKPVSYFDMLVLEKNAKKIITDSGGVQKEAFWYNVPCIILRKETEWKELMFFKQHILVDKNIDKLLISLKKSFISAKHNSKIFGNGNAALKILNKITKWQNT